MTTGPAGFAGVALQQDPQAPRWLPVGSFSRTWDAEELLKSRLELEIRALQETLSKLRHLTAYCATLEV